MIKNIIFDLGNVLVKYTPENFLEKNVKKERQEKFIETVFKSKEWLELDRGTLSYEDAIEKFAEIIPEDRESLEKLFNNNIMECLIPIEENIKVLKKLKAKGYDKVVAVTDSIMAAGLPDGEYKLGVNDVVVEDGDAKLKSNGVRAGSTLTTGTALKRLIDFTGAEMEDVLPLLTMNPAKLLGVDDKIGSLEAGKDADILIVDEGYNIVDTFVKGKKIER